MNKNYIIETEKGFVNAIVIDYKHNNGNRVYFTENRENAVVFQELEVASVLLNSMEELKGIKAHITEV